LSTQKWPCFPAHPRSCGPFLSALLSNTSCSGLMLWTDACFCRCILTGPAGEVARPWSARQRRRCPITHQPGRVQQARSRWPRRPAADARPGAPQPAADGLRRQRGRRSVAAETAAGAAGQRRLRRLRPSDGAHARGDGLRHRCWLAFAHPAVVLRLYYSVLQSSRSQRVVVRECDERRGSVNRECGIIWWVYWTR
jgi:hypothetical protein